MFFPLSEDIAFLYSLVLLRTDFIVMRPPFQSKFSDHWELLSVMSRELASLRIVPDRFPLVLKSFGKISAIIFLGSQFKICACFSLIQVESPAGPVLFSLAIRFEIWYSLRMFHIFWML